MKTFHCDHCQHLLFFESTQCVKCAHRLAFIPELRRVAALEPAEADEFRLAGAQDDGRRYRLCANYVNENVCNWAFSAPADRTLCRCCELTRTLPNLSVPGHREAWAKLEAAKRRMLYTLLELGCPVQSRREDPQRGLAYDFLAPTDQQPNILTGHDNGLITVNVAEADDSVREQQRHRLHEPYRTLLGHFRHEIGHYYWQVLIEGSADIEAFRAMFGDERADYAAALRDNYQSGPPADWEERYISSYAAVHPWEDWAESWAHYMHMIDVLETAADCGLKLEPPRQDEPSLKEGAATPESSSFDAMIRSWFPLTFLLNNLNRSMGLGDGYPFVLKDPIIAKLRFIHERLTGSGAAAATSAAASAAN